METAIHEPMYPNWVPQNTRSPFVPQAQTRSTHSTLSRGPDPRPNLDSKPPHLKPDLSMVLRPPPFPASNQSAQKEPEPTI